MKALDLDKFWSSLSDKQRADMQRHAIRQQIADAARDLVMRHLADLSEIAADEVKQASSEIVRQELATARSSLRVDARRALVERAAKLISERIGALTVEQLFGEVHKP